MKIINLKKRHLLLPGTSGNKIVSITCSKCKLTYNKNIKISLITGDNQELAGRRFKISYPHKCTSCGKEIKFIVIRKENINEAIGFTSISK